jgi:hypothetical protein
MSNVREACAAHMRTPDNAYLQTALGVMALAMARS